MGLPTGRPGPLPAPTQRRPLAGVPVEAEEVAAAGQETPRIEGGEGEEALAAAGPAGVAQQEQQGWTAEDEASLRHFLAATRDQAKLVSLGGLRLVKNQSTVWASLATW